MMRLVAGGVAAAVCASLAIAAPLRPYERLFAPIERHPPVEPHYDTWRSDGRALALLGRRLFFDTRLSATGTTACSSCHDPRHGFADPRPISISDGGQPGSRNAPSLLDVGSRPVLMWDGHFRTLEQQAFGPFQSGEMGIRVDQAVQRLNADASYVRWFREAFGAAPSAGGMARALAAFQRTLVSPWNRVDRFLVNNDTAALTPLERDGFGVFDGRGRCSTCHQFFPSGRKGSRPLFTDFQFHNLGVGYRLFAGYADPGRGGWSQNRDHWGAFRTPSLRSGARTPPYMHDGSLATLKDVVNFYSAGGRLNPNKSSIVRPLLLSPHEKEALVAFLQALSEGGNSKAW
jgi:cytochrome c peroxidase